MNKKEQRALENRIRDVMEEPAELTSDEIAKIRERAYLAYQQKIENEKQPAREKRKKSGLLRRAVAVVAIAIGLIVVSVVYSVLAPVSVSNANNFIRRAAIWVNDQLHLGISFPIPTDSQSDINTSLSSTFSTIEEAKKVTSFPIVFVPVNDDLILNGIDAVMDSEIVHSITIRYICSEGDFNILIEPLGDENTVDYTTNSSTIITSSIGNIIVLDTENNVNRAFTIYDGYLVEFFSSVSKQEFFKYCQVLSVS